ncbi:MAG TPA: tetratricopeptide repeat protein [Mariprofundaceae bacterium]|nr:tetratricopeptide repeat protein [Mariprofundaceae bacterium]
MNDKVSRSTASKSAPKGAAPKAEEHSAFDMEELKRDMRNAQLVDWAKRHQSQLVAALVAFALLLAGAALWINKARSERNAAATIYYQALSVVKDSDRQKLLQALVDRHFGTAYTAMAEMQLARLDAAHAKQHLQAVIDNSKSMPEWVWQARLDLARLWLDEGKPDQATPLLKDSVGADYEQLRQFLLAEASADATGKLSHLKLAQAAPSHDDALQRRIDSELQALEAKNTPAGS